MALDKVVDSAALDAALTAIADSIRAKAGTTDALTMADMVDAITSITSALPTGIVEIATGTFSVTAETFTHTVIHGMDNTPRFAVAYPLYWHDTLDGNALIKLSTSYPVPAGVAVGRRSVSSDTWASIGGGYNINADFSKQIEFIGNNYSRFMPIYKDSAGNTGTQIYKWIAIAIAE